MLLGLCSRFYCEDCKVSFGNTVSRTANCSLNLSALLSQLQTLGQHATEGDSAGSARRAGALQTMKTLTAVHWRGREVSGRLCIFKRHFPSDWRMLSVFIPVYQGREMNCNHIPLRFNSKQTWWMSFSFTQLYSAHSSASSALMQHCPTRPAQIPCK